MDTAVLTAYGWTDLLPKGTCEFLLDYEHGEDSESQPLTLNSQPSTGRRKPRPWRYRWPDEFRDEVRDEVLARLLKLNAERAEEARLAGAARTKRAASSKKRSVEANSVKQTKFNL
jgi:hypothetical protein